MAHNLGPYEVLRSLGSGGMAEVSLARRRGPGGVEKRLAIKRIRRSLTGDPRFVELFVREARLSMSLAHRNIAQVFDFGRVGAELFLVMEYVDGVDLDSVLGFLRDRDERLDPLLVAFIGMEACQALDYAHALRDPSGRPAGVVHRDVTPRNVLVSTSGEIKLVDFGVAAAIADDDASRIRGTPSYMAPEQARREAVDGRADVYSLGLVLWEALAGRRARPGSDSHALLELARSGHVPPLPDEVDAPLRDIVATATAADPDARYADARAVQLALDELIVSMRAGSPGVPPSHGIAALIARVARSRRAARGESEPPAGPVVTFLEAGEDALLESLADQSQAEHSPRAEVGSLVATVADSGAGLGDDGPPGDSASGPADDDEGRAPAGSAESVRSTHRVWIARATLAAAMIAAGVAVWALQSRPRASVGETSRAVVPADAAVDADPVAPQPTPAVLSVAPDARVSDARTPGPARPVSDSRTVARPADRPQPRPAMGVVKISATPWARVTVDGNDASCDETPCVLRLPEGRYALRLVNPIVGSSKRVEVAVTADREQIVNVALDPP